MAEKCVQITLSIGEVDIRDVEEGIVNIGMSAKQPSPREQVEGNK